MLQKIMEVSTGVYILWGLGVLGVLMKILANAYMSKMVRASTNLGETKRKKLRNMCRQYENKKGFGLCGGDEEAYAEWRERICITIQAGEAVRTCSFS